MGPSAEMHSPHCREEEEEEQEDEKKEEEGSRRGERRGAAAGGAGGPGEGDTREGGGAREEEEQEEQEEKQDKQQQEEKQEKEGETRRNRREGFGARISPVPFTCGWRCAPGLCRVSCGSPVILSCFEIDWRRGSVDSRDLGNVGIFVFCVAGWMLMGSY